MHLCRCADPAAVELWEESLQSEQKTDPKIIKAIIMEGLQSIRMHRTGTNISTGTNEMGLLVTDRNGLGSTNY